MPNASKEWHWDVNESNPETKFFQVCAARITSNNVARNLRIPAIPDFVAMKARNENAVCQPPFEGRHKDPIPTRPDREKLGFGATLPIEFPRDFSYIHSQEFTDLCAAVRIGRLRRRIEEGYRVGATVGTRQNGAGGRIISF